MAHAALADICVCALKRKATFEILIGGPPTFNLAAVTPHYVGNKKAGNMTYILVSAPDKLQKQLHQLSRSTNQVSLRTVLRKKARQDCDWMKPRTVLRKKRGQPRFLLNHAQAAHHASIHQDDPTLDLSFMVQFWGAKNGHEKNAHNIISRIGTCVSQLNYKLYTLRAVQLQAESWTN